MEYTINHVVESLNQAYNNKFEKVKVSGSFKKNSPIMASSLRHLLVITKQHDLKVKTGYVSGSYVYQPLYLKTAEEPKNDLIPLFTIDGTNYISRYPFAYSGWEKSVVDLHLAPSRYNFVVCIDQEQKSQLPTDITDGFAGKRFTYPELYQILLTLTDVGVKLYQIPSQQVRELQGVTFR